MKPTPQFIAVLGSRRQDLVRLQRKPCSLRTDYNFQSMLGGHSSDSDSPNAVSRPVSCYSFREISREFLGNEERRYRSGELLLFGVVTLVSAWSVVGLIEALSSLTG